jgi:hypothetical protein
MARLPEQSGVPLPVHCGNERAAGPHHGSQVMLLSMLITSMSNWHCSILDGQNKQVLSFKAG